MNAAESITDQEQFVAFLDSLTPEGEKLLLGRQILTGNTDRNGHPLSVYPTTEQLVPGAALYASTGSFIKSRTDEKGKLSASNKNIEHCLFIMLDDIGTKSQTPPIEPTWKIETSPGNYQWGYAFDPAQRPSKDEQAAALTAISAAGFNDPGATNAVRWARIPGSVNIKPERNGFASVLTEFHPERLFTLEQLCAALGVVPDAPQQSKPKQSKAKQSKAKQSNQEQSNQEQSNQEPAVKWADIESAFNHLNPDPDMPRPEWINYGLMLHSTKCPEALDFFDGWSSGAKVREYSREAVEIAWESFDKGENKPEDKKKTYLSLFRDALNTGWDKDGFDPESYFAKVPEQSEPGGQQSEQQSEQQSQQQSQQQSSFMHEFFRGNGLDPANYPGVVEAIGDDSFMLRHSNHSTVTYRREKGRLREGPPKSTVFGKPADSAQLFFVDSWFSGAALYAATGFPVIAVDDWHFGQIADGDLTSPELGEDLLDVLGAAKELTFITSAPAGMDYSKSPRTGRLAMLQKLLIDRVKGTVIVKTFALPADRATIGAWSMALFKQRQAWPAPLPFLRALFKHEGTAVEAVGADVLLSALEKFTVENDLWFKSHNINLSDDGDANLLFMTIGRGNLHYLIEKDEWIQWINGGWQSLGKEPLKLLTAAATARLRRGAALFKIATDSKAMDTKDEHKSKLAFAKKYTNRGEALGKLPTQRGVLTNLKGCEGVSVSVTTFDTDQNLLGTPTGVVDLRTGLCREMTQTDRILRTTRARHDPSKYHPRIADFLAQITATGYSTPAPPGMPEWMGGPRESGGYTFAPDRLRWLQLRLGAALFGTNTATSLEMFYGDGSNGKTVLAEMVCAALGNADSGGYSKVIPADTIMSHYNSDNNPNAPAPILAMTFGARFVSMAETEDTARLNEPLIKAVTGGDQITGRSLYKEPITFAPAFTPFLLTNALPIITAGGRGLWDRLAPFHFMCRWRRPGSSDPADAHLPKADPWFKHDAHNDPDAMSFLLSWLIEGAVEFHREQGFGERPADVLAAINSYKERSDDLGDWMNETGAVFDPVGESLQSELYPSYVRWVRGSGGKELRQKVFVQRLLERFPALTKSRQGGSGRATVVGISIASTELLKNATMRY